MPQLWQIGSANILSVTLFSICIAGFAAVSALLLFFTYAAYIRVPGKSAFSVFSCAALVACLATLEIGHLLPPEKNFYANQVIGCYVYDPAQDHVVEGRAVQGRTAGTAQGTAR